MGQFEFQGYSFANAKEMEVAKKEAESVEYIKAKLNFRDREKLRKMYDSLCEKQSFITPIGIAFMSEMHKELSMYSVQAVPGVPVTVPIELKKSSSGKLTNNFMKESQKREERRKELRDTKLRNSRIINVFLTLVIIAMFGVVLFGNTNAFRDKEEKLQDKYSSWQQQLQEKEQELNEREQALKQ